MLVVAEDQRDFIQIITGEKKRFLLTEQLRDKREYSAVVLKFLV